MLKRYIPPYATILVIVCFTNILLSTYFLSFLLAGAVFKIFSDALKKGYNYILIFSILTFLIIENIQGLRPFSLVGISMLVYYLIIPRIKHLLSSLAMSGIIYVFCFYIFLYIMLQIQTPFDMNMLMTLFLNFILDIIIIGFIL